MKDERLTGNVDERLDDRLRALGHLRIDETLT